MQFVRTDLCGKLRAEYASRARGRSSALVRCPVCESSSVTIVLNSKSHGSCACCGATWIQEGSWQRAVRPGPVKVPVTGEVIAMPDPAERPRRRPSVEPTVAEEAIAT